jgi:Leucine-rich repeat (LRR) protein
MAKQANHILNRCRGLPLAISTIGGLLANRPKTSIEWRNLHEHLGAELESDLRNITRVIVSSYDGLPYHLKSIFLYLSIFPENHEIRRTRLLRRWMAEGYIAKNRDMPVEDVAERFYSELINRTMIQPSKTSPGVRADRCRVHGMVLQIILFKFTEENQLFLVEKHCNDVPQNKIRHLVVSRWKRRGEKLSNINLSFLRSLTIIGECPLSIISPKMRMLRVLDLEDTENLDDDGLKHIGELYHLRYLCLRGTKISKLPSSLQKLRYLETLDIQDTNVTQLPDGIAKLEKLRYLLAGVNLSRDFLHKVEESGMDTQKANFFGNMASSLCYKCSDYCKVSGVDQLSVRAPEGMEKLRNLHMLGMVNAGQGSGVAGKLKKLTNLRRLGVTGLCEEEGQEIWKSIGKLNRLQRLEMRSDSIKFLATMDELTVPRHLVSLRLCGNLGSLPKWISSLNDLAKVKLLGTQLKQEDFVHLQRLPNLVLLGLWANSYIGESLCFSTGTFPKLKFLDIDGLEKLKTVTIEKETMPELEQLWVNRCISLHDSKDGLSGVGYLPNLNELLLKKCGEKKMLIGILQRQVNKHDRRPKFLIGKSIPPTNLELSITEQ